ncbi:hypothetical protein [Pseudonocardia kongjuensis]|uniref:hypothetical protein n=1 Tax=Pseudonocardia kongjuensis TaxID=102227 RepID=UPI0031D54A43
MLVPADSAAGVALPTGVRRKKARGLCGACYMASWRREDLAEHAVQQRPRDDVLDDWLVLRGEGLSLRQAAARLGMSFEAFERAFYRARGDGDERALPPLVSEVRCA